LAGVFRGNRIRRGSKGKGAIGKSPESGKRSLYRRGGVNEGVREVPI